MGTTPLCLHTSTVSMPLGTTPSPREHLLPAVPATLKASMRRLIRTSNRSLSVMDMALRLVAARASGCAGTVAMPSKAGAGAYAGRTVLAPQLVRAHPRSQGHGASVRALFRPSRCATGRQRERCPSRHSPRASKIELGGTPPVCRRRHLTRRLGRLVLVMGVA